MSCGDQTDKDDDKEDDNHSDEDFVPWLLTVYHSDEGAFFGSHTVVLYHQCEKELGCILWITHSCSLSSGDPTLICLSSSSEDTMGPTNIDEIGLERDESSAANDSEGGQAVMDIDFPEGIKIGSNNDDGSGQGNDQNNAATVTKGGQAVMDRDLSRGLKVSSDNDDGTEQRNYQKSAEKVTKGDPTLICISSSSEVTMGPQILMKLDLKEIRALLQRTQKFAKETNMMALMSNYKQY